MSKDTREYTMDDLDEILREFSDRTPPAPPKAPEGDTVRIDPVKPKKGPDTSDTKPLPDLDGDVKIFPGKTPKAPPPPRQEPIAFPRSRAQRLRQKLDGEAKLRQHTLSEQGTGSLKAAMLLQALLFLMGAGGAMLFHQAQQRELTLVVLVELLVLLLSALVGVRRLLGGVTDLLRGSFSMESMLSITFVGCLIDGLLCVASGRLPFGAVFCLQMLMAQWAQLLRTKTELSRLDTLCGAEELTAVVSNKRYFQGMSAYRTVPGEPEDYLHQEKQESEPERLLRLFCLAALGISGVLGIIVSARFDVFAGVRACAAALLAATPASVFVTLCRPEAVLEKQMHKLGLVLCGWAGLKTIEKRSVYPLDHRDLFPGNQVKLNGVRFYGGREPNTVVSYVAALMVADEGCLVEPFEQLRTSRGARKVTVEEFTSYPSGIGGQIEGMSVIAGTMDFMEKMGVELPEGAGVPHGVYAAINQSLCAVFAVSFTRSKSAVAGLRTLCQCRWVRPLLTDCDFVLTPEFLQQKMELDLHRMLFPNYLVRMELAEKAAEKGPVIALATKPGLSQRAMAVTGGAALRSAWKLGTAVHLLGGGIGLLTVAVLSLVGAGFLLTPYNLLLYGCVWMIPGLLAAEGTNGL